MNQIFLIPENGFGTDQSKPENGLEAEELDFDDVQFVLPQDMSHLR
jgi:hypothetical protein